MPEHVVPNCLARRVAHATGNDVDHTRNTIDAALSRPRDRLNLLRQYGIAFDVAQVTAIDNHMRYNRKHLAQQIILRAIAHAYPEVDDTREGSTHADNRNETGCEPSSAVSRETSRRYGFGPAKRRQWECRLCAALVRDVGAHAVWHDLCSPAPTDGWPSPGARLRTRYLTTDRVVHVQNGQSFERMP